MTAAPRSRVAAATAVCVAVALAGAACSKSGNPVASPTPAPVATVTTTVTATTTATPPVAPGTPPPTASATSTATGPSTGAAAGGGPGGRTRDFGFVREVVTPEGVKQLVWDRATLLTGAAARRAKKAHGIDPNEPPDYYVANDSTAQRLYPLAKGYSVVGSTFFGKPPAGAAVSHATFEAAFPSKDPPPMYVYFDDAGQVTKVVELYVP